jgi:hypothetical protein
VSELHTQHPNEFDERLDEALKNARAWLDIAESEAQEQRRKAWSACHRLAEEENILERFAEDLEKSGVTGERKNGQLLYLVLTSRLLDKPVSVVVKGPSSGGKSHLVKQVTCFFPASAFCFFTAMSERTLLYTDESLQNWYIILSEAAGIGGDFQNYVFQTLLSEGFLEYEFVEKTLEGLKPRQIRKEGPTGFITTTTRDKLHAENETRYLNMTVTDTREQTRQIFRTLAEEDREQPDRDRWRALQIWLETSERRITIPYASVLAEKIVDVAVRSRCSGATPAGLLGDLELHQGSHDPPSGEPASKRQRPYRGDAKGLRPRSGAGR